MAFKMKRDDTLPVLRAQLMQTNPADPTGAQIPVDLTLATAVKFLMKQDSNLKVNAPATIDLAAQGKVSYVWLPGDTSLAGPYTGEFEVTWGTNKQTFPSGNYIKIKVVEDLG